MTAHPSKKPTVHLPHLDGLRGLAALFVVLHHAYLQSFQSSLQPFLQSATVWLHYGHLAVAIFIVLSGYCLMIPIAKYGSVQGGTINFLRRRARRILPPYYGALVLSLLLIRFFPGLGQLSGTAWDEALPALNVGAVLSHVFLIQNLTSKFFFAINPALWSVATEFQIYFIFPLILIPIFKKWGIFSTVVFAFALGFSPMVFLHKGEGASPWFIGLFALGMAAADYNFSASKKLNPRLLKIIFVAAIALFFLLNTTIHLWFNTHFFLMDIICGFATTSCLANYFEISQNGHFQSGQILRAALESKSAVRLGAFSYSLYLIHMPILAGIDVILRSMNLNPNIRFIALVGFGPMFCLFLAYLFYLLIERNFISAIKKPIVLTTQEV